MNNKIRKGISLIIAAGMLMSAVPVLAEEAAPDIPVSAEETENTAVEETVAEEAVSEDESEDFDTVEFEGETADLAVSDNPGMVVDMNFDDVPLGDYSDNLTFATSKDGAQEFNIIDGAQFGRSGRLLHIAKVKPGTNQKVKLTDAAFGNSDAGARDIVVSFDFMSDNVANETFELTYAGGNSGGDICAGFRINKGSLQTFQNAGGTSLKSANTGDKYVGGEWHKIVMIAHVNEDNIITQSTYCIDGKMIPGIATEFGAKAEKANMLRMVFDTATTNANFYIDNLSVVDVKPAADYLSELFNEDNTVDIETDIPVAVEEIYLPKVFNGASIVWESSDTSIIDPSVTTENGLVKVTHPTGDKQVILKASVKLDGMYGIPYPENVAVATDAYKEFTVTVRDKDSVETDESKANRIARSIKLDVTETDKDFVLPTTTDVVSSGAEITWTSDSESVIKIDGANAKVTRPPYYMPNKEVKLTAHVKFGSATAEKTFRVSVIRYDAPMNDEENVRYAVEAMERLGLSESFPRVTSGDIDFFPSIEQATLTWTSSDTSWITNEGKIVQRPAMGEGMHEVPVSVTVTCGTSSKTLNYVIKIQPVQKAKAYPGAQGYGTQTRGGAGGYVYHVTSLAADGPGTLKEGIENKSGARIIVFDVGGTIDLTPVGRALKLSGDAGSNVTIAGQTAPGGGIQLKGYGLTLSSVEDVIIRNIKIRIGNIKKAGDTYQSDPLSASGTNKRVVLDHLSLNWGIDMGFRVDGTEVTMSNCMISKGLYWNTPHEKGKHNYAGMFRAKYGTFYNNYISDMGQRAPRIIDNEYIDVRNNVVTNSKYSFDICNYEWMGANTKFNIIGNSVLKGSPNCSTTKGGSYKYFQGRDYSGGIFAYTVNNTDATDDARAKISSMREGALWTADTSEADRSKVIGDELGVINAGGFSNLQQSWRNMVFPDDMSITDYNSSSVSKMGNTLMNYPFPAPDMTTLDPEEATKYVLTHAGAIYPISDSLNTRSLAEGRTRLKIDTDYSEASHKQGIRLTDADMAALADPTSAYGLPLETHTIYEDEHGGLQYDVDGLDVTDTEGLKVKETYKFVSNPENDVNTLYVYDTANRNKYRVVFEDYEDADGIYDKFEVYDVNNNKLTKPDNYESVGKTDSQEDDDSVSTADVGIGFTLNGKTVVLRFQEFGDGPGNYAHTTDYDDPFANSTTVDMEWRNEDWPRIPDIYRDSHEDRVAHPEYYKNKNFDSNGDGIPDFFVEMMGWNKRPDYNSKKDISRLDFDGDGYTNIEEYINDYLCGDKESESNVVNDPVPAENIRDGSEKNNTHRSHEILFNTVRRAKAQVFYAEGDTVDINTAKRIDLCKNYNAESDDYNTASDFNTYFSVLFPNVTNMEYTGEQEGLKPDTVYSYRIKTYSDSGVETISDVYSFRTAPISADASVKPGAPRIIKYIPFDKQITLNFEPASPMREYTQETIAAGEKSSQYLTKLGTPEYETIVDHYVLRYSKNADFSDAKEILISGSASTYVLKSLENDVPYYIDLRAVNAAGVESDSAVYNFKQAEKLPEPDKDGNPTYGVNGIQVESGRRVHEYYYDDELKNHGIEPTRYVVNEVYEQGMAEGQINDGETAKFITYYGDVKDWYIYTLGGIPIPKKDSNSDDRLMLMLRDDSHEHGFTYAKTFDTPLTGKSTIHARLKVVGEELDPMNQNPELRFYLQEDTGSEDSDADTDTAKEATVFGNIATITFAKNDINYNGSKIARYVDNEWYDIKMLMDSDEKTCAIYINGELIGDNYEYTNHDSEGTTSVQRWQIGSRLAGTEDVYIDYMYAYTGWDDIKDSGNKVEEGTSGARPSGGGGGGGGGNNVIIRDGDFTTSPKVDKPESTPEPTKGPGYINASFNDMGAFAWAVPAVNDLYERGVVTGVGNHLFAPDRAVTRAEFITMLMRGFSLIGDDATCTFADIKDGDWCYDAIAMAASMGIVNGRPDGTFGVNDQISRQDMAVMCVRLADAIGMQLEELKTYEAFTDEADVSDYAKESVEKLYKSGIVNGTGEGAFAPLGNANRAQAAKIIYEMIAAQK